MKRKIILVGLGLLILLAPQAVLAASSSFLNNTQKWYNSKCIKNPTRIKGQEAVLCYVFDKVNELQTSVNDINSTLTNHETRIGNLEATISPIPSQIASLQSQISSQASTIIDLESRITQLEITPTPTPIQSLQMTVATNLPTNQNSSAVTIPSGYKSVTFTVSPSGSIPGWAAQVSFDGGTTWLEQHRFACSSSCPVVTIPILGSKYRFSPGGGSGTISVSAILNPESGAQVLVLGQGITYQFTSPTFNTSGFSTITITAGGGDNPQHMTRISLQRNENNTFVEKQFLACDGGAGCPLQSLPVLGGTYQVVLEGTGTTGVLGAILRP